MNKRLDKKFSILVIEDETPIADLICYTLKKLGMETECFETGTDSLKRLSKKPLPDLVILDLTLPDMDGYKICEEITLKYSIPVIILTGRSNVMDKIKGLELGADDYITKPFDILELEARIRTVLRRVNSLIDKNNIIMVSQTISIYINERKVMKNNVEIDLTPKEFDLLLCFVNNRGIVLSRDKIIDIVWGVDFYNDTRTVDIHMQRLRKKLDEDSSNSLFKTVFGVGYTISKGDGN